MADVKGGCLYGGSLIRTPASRFKGVQVFTYKELEMATEKFSESNVIGDGGFGVAYRGVLSDGTVAAIKMLRRDGKQGERAFRIEVSVSSFIAFVSISLRFLLLFLCLFPSCFLFLLNKVEIATSKRRSLFVIEGERFKQVRPLIQHPKNIRRYSKK